MQTLLDALLRRFFSAGALDVTWPDGSVSRYSAALGPRIAVRLATANAVRRILTDPTLALGELYMERSLEMIDGSIYDFVDVVGANLMQRASVLPGIELGVRLGKIRSRIDRYNPAQRARRNVAHHYDLDRELYELFLDEDLQYSCAYFPAGGETLEQAQIAKKIHIARKLRLDRPGLRVLDIGCGWGGLGLTLARDHGCEVDGITLSTQQHDLATARAIATGLADRVNFKLLDYRAIEGSYDRIVSVGMFEHVGVAQYDAYFATLRRCLRPDGVALLHTIGRSDGPLSTNRWISKYIFPGGYAPGLSEILSPVERNGLVVTDVEVLRRHYAETLRHWRQRFMRNRARVAQLYDERFCRMWEFYLALSEMSFRRLTHVNFQLQLTRSPAAAPLIRDYLWGS